MNSILKKLPKTYPAFTELDHIHRVADALLIEHQVCCMKGDWDNALLTMDAIFHLRMGNMKDEEELLLPVYESVLPEIPEGGAVKFYLREHKLIRNKLAKFIRLISGKAQNPQHNNFSLVRLFEEYHRLKDLLDHHDARERAFLFRYLDEYSGKSEAAGILREIEKRQGKILKDLSNRV